MPKLWQRKHWRNMTARTMNIRGQEIAIDREDFASAAAGALYGPLPAEDARALDDFFTKAHNARRKNLLHPIDLPIATPKGGTAKYFWQLHRQIAPAKDLVILLYEVGEDKMPRFIKINLKQYFPGVGPFNRWLDEKDRRAEIEAVIKSRTLPIVNGKTQKRLDQRFHAKLSPKGMLLTFPREYNVNVLRPQNAINEALTQKDLWETFGFALQQLGLDASKGRLATLTAGEREELAAILAAGLRARLSAEETVSLESFKNTLDQECVKALQDCGSLGLYAYRWLRSEDGYTFGRGRGSLPADAVKVQYRLQFIQSMPVFAHLYFRAFMPNSTHQKAVAMRDLDQLIQSGKELLAIKKVEENGEIKEEAGEGLSHFARAIAHCVWPREKSFAEDLWRLIKQKPRVLRRLAKLDMAQVGDMDNFIGTMPRILEFPPEHLPTTPQAWEMANVLMRSSIPLRDEQIIGDVRGRWNDVRCGLNARLAKAKGEGGIAPEQTLRTSLENTKDYMNFLFSSLILPAALRAREEGTGQQWALEETARAELKRQFASFFTLNTLLEQSLQYHKTQVLQQYQAAVYQKSAAECAGTGWLPLTEDFTIPKGTVYNGIDIGGTTIEWLTTPEELWREGDENKNCVGTYTNQCLTNCHVLRMKAPDSSSPTGFVRTTVSMYEHAGEPGQKVMMKPGQNVKYWDVGVRQGTVSYAAWHWLMVQINYGQEEREKQKVRAKSQVPALVQKGTGLPDFTTIDYQLVNMRRRKFKPIYKNNLPYDPGVSEIFDSVLASANQHRLLPRALRGATSAEELLEKMGVKVMGGQLQFAGRNEGGGPLRPQGQGRAPAPAPAGGMGL